MSAKANDALAAQPEASVMKFEDDTSMRDDCRPTVDGVPDAPTNDCTATPLEAMATRVVDVARDELIAALELPRTRSGISNAEARP